MKNKRLVYGTLAVCLLALFLNASAVLGIGNETRLLSSNPGSRKERVPVGVLLPFSGQYSRMSENIFRVIQMIAEEVNKHGGIGGRKVVLVKGDTRAWTARWILTTMATSLPLMRFDRCERASGGPYQL